MKEDNKGGKRMSAEARETHIERVKARKTLLEKIKRDSSICERRISAIDDETEQEVPVEVREHMKSLKDPIFPYEEAVKYFAQLVLEDIRKHPLEEG